MKKCTHLFLEDVVIIEDRGKAPLCKCGCGGEVKWSRSFNRWNEYILGHSNKNKRMPDETRAKLSKAHIGKKASEETKQKMSLARRGENNPFYGKKMSEEHKLKLLQINANRIVSDETKQKLSDIGKNRICSEETKAKISKANTGRKRSKEERVKISETKKNKPIEDKLRLALLHMKPRTDGYCEVWGDKEYVNDLRKTTCDCCGITNMLCIHLFGYKLATHHMHGKCNCSPNDIQTLCNRCHAKADWKLRKEL